ncbi:hypothetical protein GCM10022222_84600 [Amycolatopsis ultiminotia]|uniref:Uncharacterized protein n=1 Tax=Amycolatopsis ultiminotia TaxID=543629 RepID=A0ABP6YPM7_9PSEU
MAQLTDDVTSLLNVLAADASSNVHPLIDSPVSRFGRHSNATQEQASDCTAGSALTKAAKLQAELSPLEQNALEALSNIGTLYALNVADDKNPQVFGTDGQYIPRATAAIGKLRCFWDIESWNVQLVAWKGTDLGSEAKMKKTFGLGLAPAKAQEAAALTAKVVQEIPALQGGRQPLLTLNAFSAPANELHGKRVLLGDGLLDVFGTLGFGDVAPEAVLGHEYGHQVDFANGNSPGDESRELGPDAYGGYFLAHAKGDAWNARTQQEVTYLDASIGDCAHDHGTPDQRKAAGAWGEKLATSQANPNRIISPASIIEKFQKEYPKLVPSSGRQSASAARS